ncbi:MAG: hypothetical protein AB1796_07885 [Bacillota bacterium]
MLRRIYLPPENSVYRRSLKAVDMDLFLQVTASWRYLYAEDVANIHEVMPWGISKRILSSLLKNCGSVRVR